MTKRIHSFDLWGTLVVQPALGPRVIQAHREVAAGKVNPATIEETVANYQAVLDGEARATGANKKAFVDALEEPVWAAYRDGKVNINFEGALYEDALTAIDRIVTAGQGYCVLTTGNSFWIRKALTDIDAGIGKELGEVYFGSKATPEPFERAETDIRAKGGQLVTHTEDQLKGFKGLLTSSIDDVTLIYVERTNLATREQVTAAGIHQYVTNLKNATYM
jgi:hypothetical protein